MSFPAIELWVVLSVAAAGFQTLRFMLQKALSTATLTATGATFARFVYSAPVVCLGMTIYLVVTAQVIAWPGATFWAFAVSGALAQVLATVAVVMLFQLRNFAVGVTLMKTEVILSVLLGLILLGEGINGAQFAAILVGVFGVLLLSKPPEVAGWGWAEIWNKSIALGLGAGLLFAVSGVCYRGASLEVMTQDPAARAGLTLAVVTTMQMLGMGLWLYLRDRPQISAVWKARRVAVWIGLMSLAGSFCWFFAFTLQFAAFVKAVGQVELVFGLIASLVFFGERIGKRELCGIAVLCVSILALVLLS